METKTDSQSTVVGESSALPNVRLSWVLREPDDFLFCDAKTGDSRAEHLCEKLLMGQKASTKDGYTKYLLDYSGPCAWANTTGQCYVTEEDRCTAMNMPYANGYCGYVREEGKEIFEGGVCTGDADGCRYSKVYEGGTCLASGGWAPCYQAKIYEGGTCEDAGADRGCMGATIYEGGTCLNCWAGVTIDGGTCVATKAGVCGVTGAYATKYRNGGCCEDYGKGFCPAEYKCP